jgi:methylene-tetrahydromethanopterin dehydrogenase
MIAIVEKHLAAQGGRLDGANVAVFGAKGIVGGVVGLIAADAGADVTLVGYDQSDVVPRKSEEFSRRFSRSFKVADGSTEEGRRAAVAQADVVLAAGRAGTQILSRAELNATKRLKVVADINAVPPAGIEGVEAKANGAAYSEGTVAIGALAIGNVKFKVQHSLLRSLHESDKARFVDHGEAFRVAREIAAGK